MSKEHLVYDCDNCGCMLIADCCDNCTPSSAQKLLLHSASSFVKRHNLPFDVYMHNVEKGFMLFFEETKEEILK
jgi:hypothetical protein